MKFLDSEFQNYLNNSEAIHQLMNFDRILLDFCIQQLQQLEENLKNNQQTKITVATLLPANTINALQNIKENDSMRGKYKDIFNQCLVLLVSHFTSALGSVFKKSINYASSCSPELLKASGDDIKISFQELKEFNFNLSENLGDVVIKKKDISFQDMQSTNRAFKNFLDIDMNNHDSQNDLIFAQASRHSIVHASGFADEKFIKQISNALPRKIKPEIRENHKIEFSTAEIEIVISNMSSYLNDLIVKIHLKTKDKEDNS
jgi:hypothetical protein